MARSTVLPYTCSPSTTFFACNRRHRPAGHMGSACRVASVFDSQVRMNARGSKCDCARNAARAPASDAHNKRTPPMEGKREGGAPDNCVDLKLWRSVAQPRHSKASAQLQKTASRTQPGLSRIKARDPLITTMPDGSTARLQSVEHMETFWTLWRYFMPLHTFEAPGHEELRWVERPTPRLRVLHYPALRLQLHAHPVEPVSKTALANGSLAPVIAEMKRLFTSLPCATLAAPQVGAALSLLLLQDRKGHCKVLANPHVVMSAPFHVSKAHQCASLPGCELPIKRPSWLVVRALNEQGEEVLQTLHGAEAHRLAASLDVLNGTLPLDQLDLRENADLRFHLRYLERLAVANPFAATPNGTLSRHLWAAQEAAAKAASQAGTDDVTPCVHAGSCFAAYHESGHALLALLMPGSTCRGVSVRKLSPGQWEGATEVEWVTSEDDPYAKTVRRMAVWLGGLAAEELMFGRADMYGGPTGCVGFGDDLVAVAQAALTLAADIRASQRVVLETNAAAASDAAALSATLDTLEPLDEERVPQVRELAGCMAAHWDEARGRRPRRRLAPPLAAAFGDALVLELVDIAYEVAVLSLSRNVRWLQALTVGLMERGKLSEVEIVALLSEEEAKRGALKAESRDFE